MDEYSVPKLILLFEEEEVNINISHIQSCLKNEINNIDRLIYNLRNMKRLFGDKTLKLSLDKTLLLEETKKRSYDFYEACHEIFSFEKRTLQKILACALYFCNGESLDEDNYLFTEFKGFCLSKLFELLPLTYSAKQHILEGYILPKDTVKTIRNKVQLILGKEALKKEDKEADSFDYNRTDYTPEDFCNFSKAQLVNIAFTLYQNYLGYKIGERKSKEKT